MTSRRAHYIHQISFGIRKKICDLLDGSGEWRNFATKVPGVTPEFVGNLTTQQLGGMISPTDKLLTKWSFRNATVSMLIQAFEELNLLHPIQLLQPVVGPDSHQHKQSSGSRVQVQDYEEKPPRYNRYSQHALDKSRPPENSHDRVQIQYHNYEQADTKVLSGPCYAELPSPGGGYNKRTESICSEDTTSCNHSMLSIDLDCQVEEPPSQPPPVGNVIYVRSGDRYERRNQIPVESVTYSSNEAEQDCHNRSNHAHVVSQQRPGLEYPTNGSVCQNPVSFHHKMPPPSLQKDHSVGEHHLEFSMIPSEQRDLEGLPPEGNPSSKQPMSRITLEFTYKEIEQATKRFHESCLIGEGGFGTVYKGFIHRSLMAVKVFNKGTVHNGEGFVEGQGINVQQHFKADIGSLERYRTDNILPLYGYSCDGPHWCLIFQYMANGSLEDRLQCKNGTMPLCWTLRHRILQDAARGLQYLHEATPPLVHGDIKSANILLDQNWVAKISDFGLARPCRKTGDTTYTVISGSYDDPVYGTLAYLPDNFHQGYSKYHKEVDTFSFGVVIFETCTGERANNPNRANNALLKDHVRDELDKGEEQRILMLKDKKASEWPERVWRHLLDLGRKCIAQRRKDRPKMNELLVDLEKLDGLAQVQKACLKSPSIQPLNMAPQGAAATAPPVLVTYAGQDPVHDNGFSAPNSPESKLPSPPADYSRLKQMTDMNLAKSMGLAQLGGGSSSTMLKYDPEDSRFFDYDRSKLPDLDSSGNCVESDCLGTSMQNRTDVSRISANDPSLFVYDHRKLADPEACSLDDQIMGVPQPSLAVSKVGLNVQTQGQHADVSTMPRTPDLYTAEESFKDPDYYEYDRSKLGEEFTSSSPGMPENTESRLEDISLPYRLQRQFDEKKLHSHSGPKESIVVDNLEVDDSNSVGNSITSVPHQYMSASTFLRGIPSVTSSLQGEIPSFRSVKEQYPDYCEYGENKPTECKFEQPAIISESIDSMPEDMSLPSIVKNDVRKNQSSQIENAEIHYSMKLAQTCQDNDAYNMVKRNGTGATISQIHVHGFSSQDGEYMDNDKSPSAEIFPGQDNEFCDQEHNVYDNDGLNNNVTSLDEAKIIAAKSKKPMFAFLDDDSAEVTHPSFEHEQTIESPPHGSFTATEEPENDYSHLVASGYVGGYGTVGYQPTHYSVNEHLSSASLYEADSEETNDFNKEEYMVASPHEGMAKPHFAVPLKSESQGASTVPPSAFKHLSHLCDQSESSSFDSGSTIIAGTPLSLHADQRVGSAGLVYQQAGTHRRVYHQKEAQSSTQSSNHPLWESQNPQTITFNPSQQVAGLSNHVIRQMEPSVDYSYNEETATSMEEDESRMKIALQLQQRKYQLRSLPAERMCNPTTAAGNTAGDIHSETTDAVNNLRYFRPGRREPVEV